MDRKKFEEEQLIREELRSTFIYAATVVVLCIVVGLVGIIICWIW